MPVLEAEGGKIKPSGYKQEYTLEQAKELARCARDPIYFIETYVMLKHPKFGAMPFKLYDFQKRLLETYMGNSKCIAMLSRQCGKALPLNTQLPTPSGWTTIGDVEVGEYVIGDDGKPSRVIAKSSVMYHHDVYKINFDNGETIDADAEHLWTVSSNIIGDNVTMDTQTLISVLEKHQDQGQGLYIRVAESAFFETKTLPLDPYVLGTWLGDGNKYDGGFTSNLEDVFDVIEQINDAGYKVGDPKPDHRRDNTVRQTIYGIRPILRDMGVLDNKHIPVDYLRGSINQRLSLLQGLMDTDGHARPRGACEFYQKDKVLFDQVYELVCSLGIKPRVRTKVIACETYYTLVFSTTKHTVFRLPRKVERQAQCVGHPKNERHYIHSIELTNSVPVQCIQIDNKSHLFLCGRSWIPTHNTQTAAAYLLWWAAFKDDQYILICSKDQGGADEIMERLWYAYEELPWWLKPGVRKNDVKTKHFDNGSKLVTKATTPSAGRGLSVSLLYLDEFAFVRPSYANEFWAAIAPTLSTGGDCIITSTPNTDEDKFSQIWFNATASDKSDVWEDKLAKRYSDNKTDDPNDIYETIFESDDSKEEFEAKSLRFIDDDEDEDEDGFVSFHAHWTSVPIKPNPDGTVSEYRGGKFKRAQMKSGLTNEEWMREFECCFIGGDSTLISGHKLASFRISTKEPRFVDKWNCRWYEQVLPNTPYAVVMDPSGDGIGDDAAIQVWELPAMRQVAEWNDAEADQDEQARMLRRILRRINSLQDAQDEHNGNVDIYYSVERNAVGIGIIRAIEYMGEENFPGWMIDASEISLSVRGESSNASSISKYRGLVTTNATKKRYAQDLKQFIERNLFTVRSKFLASQLKQFVKSGPGWGAKEGTKDDLVMSAILMCHMIDELRYQEPDLDDYVRPIIEDYDPDDGDHPDNQPMLPMV